jgi:monothiol glutaredoxin
MEDTLSLIKNQLQEHKVLLYMKGTPTNPQCGFSAQISEALIDCGTRFAFVNVLDHPELREALPRYGQWPTFPQLWVNSELIGGCDIVTQMHAQGELKPLLKPYLRDDS